MEIYIENKQIVSVYSPENLACEHRITFFTRGEIYWDRGYKYFNFTKEELDKLKIFIIPKKYYIKPFGIVTIMGISDEESFKLILSCILAEKGLL